MSFPSDGVECGWAGPRRMLRPGLKDITISNFVQATENRPSYHEPKWQQLLETVYNDMKISSRAQVWQMLKRGRALLT